MNTIVVGPRGSGKTSLLKMLHPAAMDTWNHPDADRYRERVSFIGVFVPTDLNWSEQTRCLGARHLPEADQQLITESAITTQILLALVETMSYRCGRIDSVRAVAAHNHVVINCDEERELARHLMDSWHLSGCTATLHGLRIALMKRFSDIKVAASQSAARRRAGNDTGLEDLAYLHLDFLAAARVAVEIYNEYAGELGRRWAFLFDELELAPNWLRKRLYRLLRGTDPLFLFKLSLSPYAVELKQEIAAANRPQEQHDYESISLWYVNKESSYGFSRALFRQMCSARGIEIEDPIDMFGQSTFATPAERWQAEGTAYRSRSPLIKRFKRLAEKDESFREYLSRKRISLDRVDKLSGDQRAAALRKATQIVALREFFRGSGETPSDQRIQKRRSVRVPTIYAGAESLLAMFEGNPRWIKAILGPLLDEWARSHIRINSTSQVRAVVDAANIFRAMLKTIPCPTVGGASRGLLSLLDPIGNFFGSAVIDADFDPEPPSSFTVNSNVSSEIENALGRALNAGAIVYAPDGQDRSVILESLRGKRFRLAYIFAPHYCTPLLLGRDLSLHRILDEAPERMDEPSLFDIDMEACD